MKVGILGGGQLARMLILYGKKLGIDFQVYAPQASSVKGLAPVVTGEFEDTQKLKVFVEESDLVTYEWENLPVGALKEAGCDHDKFFPSLKILDVISDRFQQKSFFNGLGVPTAPFCLIKSERDLVVSVKNIGLPVVLKTNRFGYDGKGQKIIRDEKELEGTWSEMGAVPLIGEKFISFIRELSLIACRSRSGQTAFYPLTESVHQKGILRRTLTPAENVRHEFQEKAQSYAVKVFNAFDYVGVLALELFETQSDLLLNEMASRVHNTGHWTIEGAETSQFENHLRAGLGLELGNTRLKSPAAMINLIGEIPQSETLSQLSPWQIHLYGKEPKPGRKVGHLTTVQDTREKLVQLTREAEELIGAERPEKSV